MTEYAFDINLQAVARVIANTAADARQKLVATLDCVNINFEKDNVRITEASTEGRFDLFEIDGHEIY